MPSKKGLEQALTWLRSMAADKNSLDGINAELCLNVIFDLQKQNERKGSIIHTLKKRTTPDLFSREEHLPIRKEGSENEETNN